MPPQSCPGGKNDKIAEIPHKFGAGKIENLTSSRSESRPLLGLLKSRVDVLLAEGVRLRSTRCGAG